ncbi:hypothetical protein NW767_007018 [Fusarium falciforme]|nr:hypothetical protein NW767_007018 [Fusarium falciforme]
MMRLPTTNRTTISNLWARLQIKTTKTFTKTRTYTQVNSFPKQTIKMTGTEQQKEGEKQFSIQPIKDEVKDKVSAFNAHPGPAVPKEMPQEEGTKEERKAKMEALNKK